VSKRRNVVLVGALATALAVVGGLPALAASSAKPEATEVGVSASTIRIAVVADVDNPFVPGLFQGAVDGVNGAVKQINKTGGLGGRKVKVDFIDSKLNANESRNAIITACQQDFALVGTSALFLSTADDEINCKDLKGQATGLPDLGAIVTGVPESCSPVAFPVNPPQLLCATKDQRPQTYQGNQGDAKYFQRKFGKLHGAFLVGNDTKDAARGGNVINHVAQLAGITADQDQGVSARAPQSVYTPIILKMKQDGSNYSYDTSAGSTVIQFRKEAELQGLTDPKIIWQCTTACYDKSFLDGGSAVDGQYVTLAFLPFSETSSNKALAGFIKNVGKDKASAFALYGYTAGLAFQQAMQDVVKKNGVNGITRASLLEALKGLTSFDAGGLIGKVNIGEKIATPCFNLVQLKNGKWNRVYPTKKGTFDCKPSNHVQIKADLLGS
jgi:ABC-type branched-subunit amino acid transport system substrate-binding protein